MRKLRLVPIYFALIVTGHVYAANKVTKLKQKISKYNREINLLVAKINDLESRINSNNQKYIERMKTIEGVSSELDVLKASLYSAKNEISRERKKSQKAFHYYLLEKVDEDGDNFIEKKLYEDVLKTKLAALSKLQNDSKSKILQVENLEKEFTSFKNEEETLYGLIVRLEDQKKEASQAYIDLVEQKNSEEGKLDSLIAKRRAKKKIYKKVASNKGTPFKLTLPIDTYLSAKQSKQGITLAYKETETLKAPYSGKVVYTGKLSSYGNVIILDHGHDVRSVLLGDISIKVKKGDDVSRGQVMGYTISDLGATKNLYFEVRKKDIAQNTALWLNNESKIKKI